MTPEWVEFFKRERKRDMDAMAKGFAIAIKEAVEPLEKRIAELAAACEDRKHVGTWHLGGDYKMGNLSTHAGAIWRCNADGTGARPGDDSAAWTLVQKSEEQPPRRATMHNGHRPHPAVDRRPT